MPRGTTCLGPHASGTIDGVSDKSAFNKWFGDLLLTRRMSQMEAAFLLGVHYSTISKWVSGGVQAPDYPELVRIVRTFGDLPPELRPSNHLRLPETAEEREGPHT